MEISQTNTNTNTKTKICKSFKIDRKSKLMILNKFLFVVIFISGIYFVATINDLSIKGFVLQDLKKQVNNLSSENRNIELQIMELESFDSIAKRASDMKMVRVDKIDYISVVKENVAMK
jgi:cell division protein FtsB